MEDTKIDQSKTPTKQKAQYLPADEEDSQAILSSSSKQSNPTPKKKKKLTPKQIYRLKRIRRLRKQRECEVRFLNVLKNIPKCIFILLLVYGIIYWFAKDIQINSSSLAFWKTETPQTGDDKEGKKDSELKFKPAVDKEPKGVFLDGFDSNQQKADYESYLAVLKALKKNVTYSNEVIGFLLPKITKSEWIRLLDAYKEKEELPDRKNFTEFKKTIDFEGSQFLEQNNMDKTLDLMGAAGRELNQSINELTIYPEDLSRVGGYNYNLKVQTRTKDLRKANFTAHMIPHSHTDLGWLKTVEKYKRGKL